MTIVEEVLSGRENLYVVWRPDGTEELIRTTCARSARSGCETFVFMDNEMRILEKPSKFLTRYFLRDSRNTATQAVCAMKTLINFCHIIRVPIEELEIEHAKEYLEFLRGTLGESATYSFGLLEQRSEETVAAYLKYARRYAIRMGVPNSPFLESRATIARLGGTSGHRRTSSHAIKADVVEPKEAPRYVSREEFANVIAEIDKNWSKIESCIVRLMYWHGLRVGEALGITEEDLEWKPGADGLPTYSVILRNRASDNYDQQSKSLKEVRDRRLYGRRDYRADGHGYSERIFISGKLYADLKECVALMLPDGNDPRCPCLADSVYGKPSNRYVFVNSFGRPLAQQTWNDRLRKIMVAAGLHVDKGCRKTNLNHRFRHGCAMRMMMEGRPDGRPLSGLEVMKLMRHKSLASTEVYLRPTPKEMTMLQQKVIIPIEEAFDAG